LMRKAAISFYAMTFLLFFVIQLLHVFWFYLILRMIFRLLRGVKGDSRSDSDNDAIKKDKAPTVPDEKKKKKLKE
jgi:hypothetical protein